MGGFGAGFAGVPIVGGSATAPNPYLESDPTTGLFDKASGDLGFAASGLQVANLTKTALNLDNLLAVTGALTLTALATPGTPTIANVGTAGATTYTYKIVATVGGRTTDAGAAGSTATGNATLSGSNYNTVTWTAVTGATGYDVYRTVGGATLGKIGSAARGVLTLNDTGLAGDAATAPTINLTGSMKIDPLSGGDSGNYALGYLIFPSTGFDALFLDSDPIALYKAGIPVVEFSNGQIIAYASDKPNGVAISTRGDQSFTTATGNGTRLVPTAVLSGDLLFYFAFRGQRSSVLDAQIKGAQIEIDATENWGVGANGAKIVFQNGANGGVNRTTWTMDQDGGLLGALTTSYAKLPQVILTNDGAEPSATADQARLYSADLSAGNATLGIATETAVVTETVTSDRTLSVRINGVTYKICLKS
ncbi:MAG: hypothetical protein U1B30_15685 [Pseudomonadota bacterium]|nr:hypothetical protein [Pseudomonadota bacterium]